MEQAALKLTNRVGLLYQICNSISFGQDLETLDLDIYNLVSAVIPLDVFYLGLYVKKTNLLDLIFIMDEGLQYSGVPEPLTTDFESRAIINKETLVLNRTEEDINSLNQDAIITVGNKHKISKSIVVSPLVIPGKVVGVLSVQSYSENMYSATEAKLMKIICSQIAGALEKNKKFQSKEVFDSHLKVSEEKGGYSNLVRPSSLQEDYEKVLLQKEKLQSIIDLATMLSHEMNQPLTGITGYCALIQEELEEEQSIYNDLLQIQKQTKRLEKLITDFQCIVQLADSESSDSPN